MHSSSKEIHTRFCGGELASQDGQTQSQLVGGGQYGWVNFSVEIKGKKLLLLLLFPLVIQAHFLQKLTLKYLKKKILLSSFSQTIFQELHTKQDDLKNSLGKNCQRIFFFFTFSVSCDNIQLWKDRSPNQACKLSFWVFGKSLTATTQE